MASDKSGAAVSDTIEQPRTGDVCKECLASKHRNCWGDSWDFATDEGALCPCWLSSGARAGEPCMNVGPPGV